MAAWEAASRVADDAGRPADAARCAFWLAVCLMLSGRMAQANGWLQRVRRMIAEAEVDCAASGYLLIPDPDALAELLGQAGLRDVSATRSTARLQLPAPAEFLWQYINLTPMAPVAAQASEAARSTLERQVVLRWQPHVVDGRLDVEQPMVLATGRA